MVAFQTSSPRVLPCLSTTAHCRDSSMQLQLTLRKTLLVFLRLCFKSCAQVMQHVLLLVHHPQQVLCAGFFVSVMLSTASSDHCEIANRIAGQAQMICAVERTDSMQLRTAFGGAVHGEVRPFSVLYHLLLPRAASLLALKTRCSLSTPSRQGSVPRAASPLPTATPRSNTQQSFPKSQCSLHP